MCRCQCDQYQVFRDISDSLSMCDPVWIPSVVPFWKPTHCYPGIIKLSLSPRTTYHPLPSTHPYLLFLSFLLSFCFHLALSIFLGMKKSLYYSVRHQQLSLLLPYQGYPLLLPGKCWAFHGVQGTLVISLSHPITITHVTLDHLPRYNSPTGRIDSAPKDFEVYVSDHSLKMRVLEWWMSCMLSTLEYSDLALIANTNVTAWTLLKWQVQSKVWIIFLSNYNNLKLCLAVQLKLLTKFGFGIYVIIYVIYYNDLWNQSSSGWTF